MIDARLAAALLTTGVLAGGGAGAGTGRGTGPYDIPLFATATAPGAQGSARLAFSASPFGVTMTADGHARYDVIVSTSGLPAPSALGHFSTYVAWAATPDLRDWSALGTVGNGTATVGPVALNKFLLVITAEAADSVTSRHGPTVLHGTSPSGWLQSFLSHPLFRGIPPGG